MPGTQQRKIQSSLYLMEITFPERRWSTDTYIRELQMVITTLEKIPQGDVLDQNF